MNQETYTDIPSRLTGDVRAKRPEKAPLCAFKTFKTMSQIRQAQPHLFLLKHRHMFRPTQNNLQATNPQFHYILPCLKSLVMVA
jgi:hypothetical protein